MALYDDEYYDQDEWDERVNMFARPGSNSALRRASEDNPRNLPCPNCGAEPPKQCQADRDRLPTAPAGRQRKRAHIAPGASVKQEKG